MRKIYIMLLMSSVVLLTACDMLDIQPTGKVIPQTLAEYRALIATAYITFPMPEDSPASVLMNCM